MGTAFPGAALSKEHYENTLKVLEDEGVYNGQTLPNMISLNNLTVRTFLKILNFLKKSSENVWTLKKLTFWKILNFLKIFELFENFRTFWKLCTFELSENFVLFENVDLFQNFWTFWKFWTFGNFLKHFVLFKKYWHFLEIKIFQTNFFLILKSSLLESFNF